MAKLASTRVYGNLIVDNDLLINGNKVATESWVTNTAKAKSAGAADTAAKLTTARTLTIGSTGKTFDGSGNVSWSLAEIGAAAASHDHSRVQDSGNGSNTTFAYSRAGMGYDDYSWLAGWNGYELRAVSKTQFARADHSHSYLPLDGGQMSKPITFSSSAGVATDATPSAISYGLFQAYGDLKIAGNTDKSGTEFVMISAGQNVADITATNSLAIGTDTLKWKNNNIATENWVTSNTRSSTWMPTAGSNITISGNTISATDTTYSNASTSVTGLMSTGTQTFAGSKTFNSTVNIGSGANLNFNSDKRMKNINSEISYSGVLNKLSNIKIYDYVFKKDELQNNKIGVMAQDVEDQFPEIKKLLIEDSGYNEEYDIQNQLSIKHDSLVYLLWMGLQEANEKIKKLEEMIYDGKNNS